MLFGLEMMLSMQSFIREQRKQNDFALEEDIKSLEVYIDLNDKLVAITEFKDEILTRKFEKQVTSLFKDFTRRETMGSS